MGTYPDPILESLEQSQGAIYYRCALQVNPHRYSLEYRGDDHGLTEEEYNKKLIKKCKENNIQVLGITDHHNVDSIKNIKDVAADENISVFPGFEVRSKEGIDIICLFPLESNIRGSNGLEGYIGWMEINDGIAKKSFDDIVLQVQEEWGGICIAAHVTNNNGLLTMEGKPREKFWNNDDLLAAQIPGRVDDLEESPNYKGIVKNEVQNYKRARAPEEDLAIAVINAKDVAVPEDLDKDTCSTFIKMSEPSIEALRQAFLDPRSRVRLVSEEEPEPHMEIEALSWEGGFMDGLRIHFNSNLNGLIGGRGTGKSALVESLRFVLDVDPLGDEATKTHNSMKKGVIKPGTKVSCLINSPDPTPTKYVVERTHPNPPKVTDEDGNLLEGLTPSDIIPDLEIYGQHEISEVTADKKTLTRLLDRFTTDRKKYEDRRDEIELKLKKNRARIIETNEEIETAEDKLEQLASLKEKIKQYEKLGLEEKLKQKNMLIKEENIFKNVSDKIGRLDDLLDDLKSQKLSIEKLIPEEIEDSEAKNIFQKLRKIMSSYNNDISESVEDIKQKYSNANEEINSLKEKWKNERKKKVEKETEKALQEIQQDIGDVDTEGFLELKEKIEDLKPLQSKLEKLNEKKEQLLEERRNMLSEWEETDREIYQSLNEGAEHVNNELSNKVRVKVDYRGDRKPIKDLLRKQPGGQLKSTIQSILDKEEFSVFDFVEKCRDGATSLYESYGGTENQAERICEEGEDLFMKLEELKFPHTTTLKLNLGSENNPSFEELGNLSKGQKATATLLLLLLESEHPLIIDQPEDDLDNQFISSGIVPRIRDAKRKRQFIFSTHNANIPVLGDAELIIALKARGEADEGKAEVKNRGSIDVQDIQQEVENILEGGENAFEKRRLKYGF